MSGALKLFKIAHNELDATICEGTRRVGESRCMDWIKPVTVVQVKQPRSALFLRNLGQQSATVNRRAS